MTEEWDTARKKPVEVEYRGPYYTKPSNIHPRKTDDAIETIEGDYEITNDYLREHGGYVIIRGVNGEVYPCALDVFRQTYETGDPVTVSDLGESDGHQTGKYGGGSDE